MANDFATCSEFFVAVQSVLDAETAEQIASATRYRDRLAAALPDAEHDRACRAVHELLRVLMWPPKVSPRPLEQLQAEDRAAVDALCGLVRHRAEKDEADDKLGALNPPRASATLTLVK